MLVRDQAALRGVAPDDPDRDFLGSRIGQRCQAGVPVAVLEVDRLVRPALSIWVSPCAFAMTSPSDQLAPEALIASMASARVSYRCSVGSCARMTRSATRSAGGSSRIKRSGRKPAAGREAAVIAPHECPTIARSAPSSSRRTDEAREVRRSLDPPMPAAPTSGAPMAWQVDGDDATAGGGEARADAPERLRVRGHSVNEEERRIRRVRPTRATCHE